MAMFCCVRGAECRFLVVQTENHACLGMGGQGKDLLALLSSPLQNMCCCLAPVSPGIIESCHGLGWKEP